MDGWDLKKKTKDVTYYIIRKHEYMQARDEKAHKLNPTRLSLMVFFTERLYRAKFNEPLLDQEWTYGFVCPTITRLSWDIMKNYQPVTSHIVPPDGRIDIVPKDWSAKELDFDIQHIAEEVIDKTKYIDMMTLMYEAKKEFPTYKQPKPFTNPEVIPNFEIKYTLPFFAVEKENKQDNNTATRDNATKTNGSAAKTVIDKVVASKNDGRDQ